MTRGRARAALWIAAIAASGGCVGRTVTAAERGRALASDPALTDTAYNAFACTTCHAERPGASARTYPGAALAGATARPTFWGGRVLTLRDAVSICMQRFMRGDALDPTSDEGVALYAYLEALTREGPAETRAVPFTVEATTAPPPAGNAARGAAVYGRACAVCHGEARSGAGRLGASVVVPDASEAEHTAATGYTDETLRQLVVQKVRHGGFLAFAGVMPPFSREALSDADVADLVAYLNPRLRP